MKKMMHRRHPIAWSLFGCFVIGNTDICRDLETCCRRRRHLNLHPHSHRGVGVGVGVGVVDAFVTPPPTTIQATSFQQRGAKFTTTTSSSKQRTILPFIPRRMDDPSSTLATTTATASTTTHTKLVLSSNRNDNEILSSFLSSAFKTTTASKLVEVGDTIVCKRSIPTLGILENSSHVVTSIYTQYFDEETQQIVKIPLNNLPLDAGDYGGIVVAGDQRQGRSSSSNSKVVYMTLFVQPSDYTNNRVGEAEGGTNVIVTPEEVGLVSVQNELGNAIWLAVPGLFWVGVATSFYNTYHERTGGSLEDAFWGR